MRRLLLAIFSLSAALSPVCPMAHADSHGAPVTHLAACEAAGRRGASGMCGQRNEGDAAMSLSQSTCADGFCLISSSAQEYGAPAPDALSPLGIAFLPPSLEASVIQDRTTVPDGARSADGPPPDLLSGVVIRE